MRQTWTLIACLCLGLFQINADVSAQRSRNVSEDSCAKARRVLDSGISAMGGVEVLQSLTDISREIEGVRVEIGQTLKPDMPYTTQPYQIMSVLDFSKGRSFEEVLTSVIGGF